MGDHLIPKLLSLISITASAVAAQSTPPKKNIPAIAKAANRAVVTIVMSDKDGKPIAQGSGFFISNDGITVTNYHVIAQGSSAVVKLPDGAFYVVDGVLASDKAHDIAVIKVHGQDFSTLILGNSDRLQVGEEVVAIGNPLSLESTVSNGIVSGIRTDEELGGKLLQVTTPISPGSSGGPLFNMTGEVVGITTMYLKGGENLNFAIPINDAKTLLEVHPSRLQVFPDESELAKPDGNAPPSAPASTPDLEATVEFMNRMVEPEHRRVLLGTLEGTMVHPPTGRIITIVSSEPTFIVLPTGVGHEHGYPELLYRVWHTDDEGIGYPTYVSFSLASIDPSSIQCKEGGYDPETIHEFMEKHPNCEANPQCSHEYMRFLDSAPKLAAVQFHTTDLNPLIERGGCSNLHNCRRSKTTGREMIFLKNKDRAERFVTALTHAVELEGGRPDLFPPRD